MSDELRERIADTIAISLFGPIGTVRRTDALRAADAVIAALDSRGWLIDPESGDRRRRASNRRWLKGEDDHD